MSRQRKPRYTTAEVIERLFADESSEYEDDGSNSESDDFEIEPTTTEFDPNIPGPSGLQAPRALGTTGESPSASSEAESLSASSEAESPSASSEAESRSDSDVADEGPPAKTRKTCRGRARGRPPVLARGHPPAVARGRPPAIARGRPPAIARGRPPARRAAAPPRDARFAAAEWTAIVNKQPFQDFGITTPGPTIRYTADNFSEALDYFQLYFSDNILALIVDETNRYQRQCVQNEPTKHKRAWDDVSMEEMKCFIGILMQMGVVKLPRMTSYWSSDKFLHQSAISDAFPLVRFQQIWRYLHLADNENAPPRNAPDFDKIYRVRTFLNMLSTNCENNYTPNKEITVDETMVAHKGRLSYKQYMKAKPTKWGIKIWVLSESPSGYVYKFDVYLGKATDVAGGRLSHRVVHSLVDGLSHRNHHLYMDNFYSDPVLFEDLLASGTYACGTVRSNRRGLPDAIKIAKRDERRTARGAYKWRQNKELLALSWFDKRPVYFLSTIHEPYADMVRREMMSVIRHQPDGTEVQVPCPPASVAYQTHMRAVDHGDQMMQLLNVARKSKKAWKKLLCYGIEVAKLNAFIVENHFQPHSREKGHDRDFLEFTMELCHGLMQGLSFRKKIGRPPTLPLDAIDALRLSDTYHESGHGKETGLRCVCSTCSRA